MASASELVYAAIAAEVERLNRRIVDLIGSDIPAEVVDLARGFHPQIWHALEKLPNAADRLEVQVLVKERAYVRSCDYREKLLATTADTGVNGARNLHPDAQIGIKRREQQARFGHERGKDLRQAREPEWERWRKEAQRLIAIYPHLGMPGKKSELARRVKKSLSLSESVRTIRNRL